MAVWAFPAGAQDLRGGLDADQARAMGRLPSRNCRHSPKRATRRRNTHSARCTRMVTASNPISCGPKSFSGRPGRGASGARARISNSCASRASLRRWRPAASSNGVAVVSGADGWRVQLATVPSSESAQREFRRLSRQFGELLAGTDLLAPPFTMPDGAQVVRVQAGPLSETRARDICAKLRDLNAGCRVIRPEG